MHAHTCICFAQKIIFSHTRTAVKVAKIRETQRHEETGAADQNGVHRNTALGGQTSGRKKQTAEHARTCESCVRVRRRRIRNRGNLKRKHARSFGVRTTDMPASLARNLRTAQHSTHTAPQGQRGHASQPPAAAAHTLPVDRHGYVCTHLATKFAAEPLRDEIVLKKPPPPHTSTAQPARAVQHRLTARQPVRDTDAQTLTAAHSHTRRRGTDARTQIAYLRLQL